FVSILIDDKHATIKGMATVNGASGYTFDVHMEDNGEPGRGADRFRIELSGPTSYDSNAYAANGGLLTGGNIPVHKEEEAEWPGDAQSDSAPQSPSTVHQRWPILDENNSFTLAWWRRNLSGDHKRPVARHGEADIRLSVLSPKTLAWRPDDKFRATAVGHLASAAAGASTQPR